MRIEMKNGVVVCRAEDWDKLQDNERKFLSDEYWTATWLWGEGEYQNLLVMRKTHNVRSQVSLLHSTLYHAENRDISVDLKVRLYLNDIYQLAREEEKKAWQDNEAIERRKRWKYRQEHGCDNCPHKHQIGDAWIECRLSGDTLDVRFMEVWNTAHRCMDMFHETGVPNEHCKDYYEEKTIKREV